MISKSRNLLLKCFKFRCIIFDLTTKNTKQYSFNKIGSERVKENAIEAIYFRKTEELSMAQEKSWSLVKNQNIEVECFHVLLLYSLNGVLYKLWSSYIKELYTSLLVDSKRSLSSWTRHIVKNIHSHSLRLNYSPNNWNLSRRNFDIFEQKRRMLDRRAKH